MSLYLNNYASFATSDAVDYVGLYDASQGVVHIDCETGSQGNYLFVVCDAQVTIDMMHTDGSQAIVHAIVLSSGVPSVLRLTNTIVGSDVQVDTHIVSFCTPHSDITVDGNIIIQPGVSGSTGNLLEQNLLLGGSVRLRTLPVLDVRSNDISASHGAKVDRIDPMQLFYCMSRGLDRQQSTQLIIDSIINDISGHVHNDHLHSLRVMLSNYVLSLSGISGPQIKAPSNLSHRLSHHLH